VPAKLVGREGAGLGQNRLQFADDLVLLQLLLDFLLVLLLARLLFPDDARALLHRLEGDMVGDSAKEGLLSKYYDHFVYFYKYNIYGSPTTVTCAGRQARCTRRSPYLHLLYAVGIPRGVVKRRRHLALLGLGFGI